MDLKSFIESGLLEAYVLGQASAAERAEVERMAAAHPEVRAELDAIEQSLEKLALANAVPPPAGLKEQLQQRIEQDKELSISPKSSRLSSRLVWLLAAVALAALAAVFYFIRENARLDGQVAELQTQIRDCKDQLEKQARLQDLIALLRDRDTRSIVLSDGPEAKITATVWFNPARKQSVLDINSLPAPNPGKHFQLWAIVEGQALPLSLGMVNTADSWQALEFVENVKAFAISEEDKPEGNPTPTVVVLVGPV